MDSSFFLIHLYKQIAHFILQAAVGSSEVFPCVSAAVRSSNKILYHQAHVDKGETVTYGERSLLTQRERDTTNLCLVNRYVGRYVCYVYIQYS